MRHDALVIGGGPVGLTCALLLSRQGLRVALLERDELGERAPSAVSLDDECLRIWQACGVGAAIERGWSGGEPGAVMCEYLSANRKPFLRLTQNESDLGYPSAVCIHLASIVDQLVKAARLDPSIEIFEGWRVVDIDQDERRAVIEARDAGEERLTLRGAWAVACDGGASVTRSRLGIRMSGTSIERPWVIAEVEDGAAPQRVQILCDPAMPSVRIPMPHGVIRIERQLGASDDGAWIQNDARLGRFIGQAWPGLDGAPIRARAVRWFQSRLADRWREGRVFLAGDAAHLTPPFAGQGLASGLRDVFNLAFKIAGAQKGWLPIGALDTYESERRPHMARMLRLARRLGGVMAPRSAAHALVTQNAIRAVNMIEPLRAALQMRGPGIRPLIREGFFTPGGRAGSICPQPFVVAGGSREVRFDSLLGARMTWVALGDGANPGRLPHALLTPTDTSLIENRDFRDERRTLQRCFGPGSLILIRPDRVVHTHRAVGLLRDTNTPRTTAWRHTRTPEPARPSAQSPALAPLSA